MRPICDTIRLGGVRIARETYVYYVELNEWIAHMEAIAHNACPTKRVRCKYQHQLRDQHRR